MCVAQCSQPGLRRSPALSVSSFRVAKGLRMSTTNWHLPRALPATEQGHLPSAFVETEPCAALAVDLQQPLREFRGAWGLCAPGNLVGQVFRQLDIFRNRFYDPNPFCLFCLVAQLYLTLCNPMDCSPPGSSIHEIFQTREDLEIQNLFLKTSNYLKTCPTRFPGAQSASLHPELPQGLLKINSYRSMGFNLHGGNGKCLCFSVIGNALGKC